MAHKSKTFVYSQILTPALERIQNVGVLCLYLQRLLITCCRPPFRFSLVIQQMEFIGNQSVGIVLLTGVATGAVFGMQIGGVFAVFQAEGLIGGATGIALATELAPLITGFVLTGRVGASMAAEIATMVVNEQIDAMEAMGVDPTDYLVAPRVWASVTIMPLLCALFMIVGTIGVYFVGIVLFQIDEGVFYDRLTSLVVPHDIIVGLRKMVVFSFAISVISCLQGLKASKGAQGVGRATTQAVVRSLIAILVSDFIIAYTEFMWLS